ncbi:uncharacterized protein LOC132900783 [Neoarius graeffei]|uniref:uncharacterized protein LOC132900783 n=1 Tax=Neoarius graeffei TaxID=443677 RepID=UPI00298D5809|nr:uncharacterized protein LOC132900783 [Neoarius graeffei]XP_060799056.1 uncharacterized protein LOC132900783 [Neoarius graeffei]
MEVGAVVRIPDVPGAALDRAGAYRIPTDASDRRLGAVLSQEVEGEDCPVLYVSRKLSVHEGRYSTIEKECLAIKWAVLALRYYLLGCPFTLCSDHAPLQWLHCMKDANAQITRWYLALQPFNFKVIHRPGAQMVMADFISRWGGESVAGRTAARPESGGRGMWQRGCGQASVCDRRAESGKTSVMLTSSAPRTCLSHPDALCLAGVSSHRSCGGRPHMDSRKSHLEDALDTYSNTSMPEDFN